MAYDDPEAPGIFEIGGILTDLFRGHYTKQGTPWKEEGLSFLKRLQADAMANSHELVRITITFGHPSWRSGSFSVVCCHTLTHFFVAIFQADQIPEAAQRMWTSALTLRGREFCYILNAAVRSDDEEMADSINGRADPRDQPALRHLRSRSTSSRRTRRSRRCLSSGTRGRTRRRT